MLQAGEKIGGYVVGQQHWRWRDYGDLLEVCVELGEYHEVGKVRVFVPIHRLIVRWPGLVLRPPAAIGFGPRLGAHLRQAIEQAADRGGPWV